MRSPATIRPAASARHCSGRSRSRSSTHPGSRASSTRHLNPRRNSHPVTAAGPPRQPTPAMSSGENCRRQSHQPSIRRLCSVTYPGSAAATALRPASSSPVTNRTVPWVSPDRTNLTSSGHGSGRSPWVAVEVAGVVGAFARATASAMARTLPTAADNPRFPESLPPGRRERPRPYGRVTAYGTPRIGTHRTPGRRGRARRLAARRRLGHGQRGRRARHAGRGGRRRRDLHRHRRRLRRRPQRAADRPVPAQARRPELDRGHQDGPPGGAGAGRTTRWTNFRAWTDRSRANLGVDTLDLVQLHCPPTAGLLRPTRSSTRSTPWSRRSGIAAYGVSVETCDEALTAIARPGVATRADHPQRVPAQAAGAGAARRRARPASASSPGCRWPAACCPAGTTSTPRSPPTTTAPTTGTARRSTSARPSPASTSPPAWRRSAGCAPLVPRGRDDGPVRAALDHRPARRHRGHPRRPQPGAGPGQRRGRRPGAAARRRTLAPYGDVYDELIRPQVHDRW